MRKIVLFLVIGAVGFLPFFLDGTAHAARREMPPDPCTKALREEIDEALASGPGIRLPPGLFKTGLYCAFQGDPGFQPFAPDVQVIPVPAIPLTHVDQRIDDHAG